MESNREYQSKRRRIKANVKAHLQYINLKSASATPMAATLSHANDGQIVGFENHDREVDEDRDTEWMFSSYNQTDDAFTSQPDHSLNIDSDNQIIAETLNFSDGRDESDVYNERLSSENSFRSSSQNVAPANEKDWEGFFDDIDQAEKDKSESDTDSEDETERLFQAIEEVKANLRAQSSQMNKILSVLTVLRRTEDRQTTEGRRQRAELPEGFTFPLSCPEDADKLDKFIEDNEEARKSMVRHLMTVGGRDVKSCTRAIMAKLMSTLLARQYNFFGMKGKKAFKDLRCVLKTIHDGVRRLYPNTTELEMRNMISNWLSGARDRDRGKQEREEARTKLAELHTTALTMS